MAFTQENVDQLRVVVRGMTEDEWDDEGVVPTHKLMLELVDYIDDLEAEIAVLRFELEQFIPEGYEDD